MLITRIEQGKSKRFLIYCEDLFLFALYPKEIRQFHIEEGSYLDDSIISSIKDEIIFKRAKERALYLLERKPMTQKGLWDKLTTGEYPSDIIERVISFLQEYHYLDDSLYVHLYVETYGDKKSGKQIRYNLMQKGISKDLIDDYFETHVYTDEVSFSRLFEKYIKNKDLSDYRVRQKVFRYFYGKGFSSSLIESYIRSFLEQLE